MTVITPLEYFDILRPFLTMNEIGQIAEKAKIQESDLAFLGLGKGSIKASGKTEATYFVIIESARLRKIRQHIYNVFIQRGGESKTWNPQRFFPHTTVGYTLRDLHEADGVLKNMENSFDNRFEIVVR